MQLHLSQKRQAQLNLYAQRHGQNPEAALDEVLATAFAWLQQDYEDAVQGISRGYDDLSRGQTRSAAEAFSDLRAKHAPPR